MVITALMFTSSLGKPSETIAATLFGISIRIYFITVVYSFIREVSLYKLFNLSYQLTKDINYHSFIFHLFF